MSVLATTKLSSKGQVVIPEEIRENLGLKEGVQFVVIGQGDTVILKMITIPPLKDIQPLLSKVRKQAKKVGLEKDDIKKAIVRARSRK